MVSLQAIGNHVNHRSGHVNVSTNTMGHLRGASPRIPRQSASGATGAFNEERQRLRRAAEEEERRLRAEAQRAAVAALSGGDLVYGRVMSVRRDGALVQLQGGAAAVLHGSRVSGLAVADVGTLLTKGEEIKVSFNAECNSRGASCR